MSKAIQSFATIYNNPFIFVPLFAEFYASLGPQPKSVLASYVVLPLCLHPETRKFFTNAKKTSTLHTFTRERSRLYGLPERVARYRTLTNTTLQHGFNLEELQLGADLSIHAQVPRACDFCPAESAKAARNLGKIVAPFDMITLYRVLGIKSL
jgi:hypothetical protein